MLFDLWHRFIFGPPPEKTVPPDHVPAAPVPAQAAPVQHQPWHPVTHPAATTGIASRNRFRVVHGLVFPEGGGPAFLLCRQPVTQNLTEAPWKPVTCAGCRRALERRKQKGKSS